MPLQHILGIRRWTCEGRHAVSTGFYSTSWALDVDARKPRHAVCIGFYSTSCTGSAENTGVADVFVHARGGGEGGGGGNWRVISRY